MAEFWRPMGVAVGLAAAVVGLWLAIIPTAITTVGAGTHVENCGVPVLDLGKPNDGVSPCQQANRVRALQAGLTILLGGLLGGAIWGYGEYQRLEQASQEEAARRVGEARRSVL